MARDPYDHGQEEIPCPVCHGLGQVVEPEAWHNPVTDMVEITQRARACIPCGGKGKVWA